MRNHIALAIILLSSIVNGQVIKGKVTSSSGETIPFVNVFIKGTDIWTTTDESGNYILETTKNKFILVASMIGFISERKTVILHSSQEKIVNFTLTETAEILDQVTVTGTRTDKRRTNSPVIVNVINSQTLADVQACNLSEGLKFQTGLRVETDCQTCNYTQLRMNGLAGGYSQILINFNIHNSPLQFHLRR